jgi:undecaprenyl pyrophosphate phosphatase UppP
MQEDSKTKLYLAQTLGALSVAFELGFIIALPVVFLALIGKHYDQKLHTHFIVYLCLILALTISSVIVYMRLETLVKRLQKVSQKIPDKTNNDFKK